MQYDCKIIAAQKQQRNVYRHCIRERKRIPALPRPDLNIQQCYSKLNIQYKMVVFSVCCQEVCAEGQFLLSVHCSELEDVSYNTYLR